MREPLGPAAAPGTLWIDSTVVAAIAADASAAGDQETGGMLLGWTQGDAVVVVGATGAGPLAKRSRYSMKPDTPWQKEQLREAYQRSARTVTYLGDWHTHPHGLPLPSETDHTTALRVANYIDARVTAPLTLILGADGLEWLMAPFQLRRSRFDLLTLRMFEYGGDTYVCGLEERPGLLGALTDRCTTYARMAAHEPFEGQIPGGGDSPLTGPNNQDDRGLATRRRG